MRTERIPLLSPAPGLAAALTLHRFGEAGARPKAYVQAALHADEMPGTLAALHLRQRLEDLEAAGRIAGEVVLVPLANPLGLGQRVLGTGIGRFDLSDGANFNRHFPYLTPAAADLVEGRLGADAGENVALIRAALVDAAAQSAATTPAAHLKRLLASLALDADLVLDLHCDSEAVTHLYTLTPLADALEPLARLLGCEAVLLADVSGDDPFDEVCSRPWHELARRFAGHPFPLACHAATVELRGEADVSHPLAGADAEAILGFLVLRGIVEGKAPPLPPARCRPTPLAGSEPLTAPVDGIVVFAKAPGERVQAGEVVAEMIDPLSGSATPVRAGADGFVYARTSARYAPAGRRLCKIAGTTIQRHGKLLSP